MLPRENPYFFDDNDDDAEVHGHEKDKQNSFMQYNGILKLYFHYTIIRDLSRLLCKHTSCRILDKKSITVLDA